MDFQEIQLIDSAGFAGAVPVHKLQRNCRVIPDVPGVYLIVRDTSAPPMFLEKGTGGWFKGQDPSASTVELHQRWVEKSVVLYIGKAERLQRRLCQYMRFGAGSRTAHWGGRHIWQLADAKDLLVFWRQTEESPRSVERELSRLFGERFRKRPFANLVG